MDSKSHCAGFVMSLEAACSLLLLLAAASMLAMFSLQSFPRPSQVQDFFLCTDAAAVLAKSGFSGEGALQNIRSAANLSNLCIDSSGAFGDLSSGCIYSGAERYSFTFPVWQEGSLLNATVFCWKADS